MKDESGDHAILLEIFCQQSFNNVCPLIKQLCHINNNSNNTVGTIADGSTPQKIKKR